MLAERDVARHPESGRPVRVPPLQVTPDADIYAVCPQRRQLVARARAFVDSVARSFDEQAVPPR